MFDHAIKNSTDYDDVVARKASSARSREDLFFELALADLSGAAETFRPIHERTDDVDGWVSLEVSPLLSHDTERMLASARSLHPRKLALIRREDTFSLAPWKPVLEPLRGQAVTGVVGPFTRDLGH